MGMKFANKRQIGKQQDIASKTGIEAQVEPIADHAEKNVLQTIETMHFSLVRLQNILMEIKQIKLKIASSLGLNRF